MNYIKEIRQQYRISQTALAAMLGLSRSQVSMAEGGFRDLPAPALARLQQMMNANNSAAKISKQPLAKKTTDHFMEAHDTALQKILTIRRDKLLHKLFLLQQQLSIAEKRFTVAIDTLQHAAAHRTIQQKSSQDHLHEIWLNSTEATARLQLRRAPKYAVELLRIKTEALEAEISIIDKTLIGL